MGGQGRKGSAVGVNSGGAAKSEGEARSEPLRDWGAKGGPTPGLQQVVLWRLVRGCLASVSRN